MNGCGHSPNAPFCSEDCFEKWHEQAHGDDPQRFWGECVRCVELIEAGIDSGKRTKNGDLVNEDEISIDKSVEADARPEK